MKVHKGIERYLPFPVLVWRAVTQPLWGLLAWLIDSPFADLLVEIKLRQRIKGLLDLLEGK